MAAKEVAKGMYICQEGQTLDAIHIIIVGSVCAKFPGGSIILKKGDVVGLADIAYDSHFITYSTLETCSFVSFPIKDSNSLGAIIRSNPEVAKMIYTSMISQSVAITEAYKTSLSKCSEAFDKVHKLYDNYQDICLHNNIISRTLPGLDEITAPNLGSDIPEWLCAYYACMKDFPPEIKHSLAARIPYINGLALKSSKDIHMVLEGLSEISDYMVDIYRIMLRESRLDLFDLYTSVLYRLAQGSPDVEQVNDAITFISDVIKESNYPDADLLESRIEEYKAKLAGMASATVASSGNSSSVNTDLANATDIILEYAGVSDETASNFKNLIAKYKKLSDKASTEEGPRKLRNEITNAFYEIYREAFQMSVKDFTIPKIVKMFFNFGFVDAELAGAESANYLYSIADTFRGNEDLGVYSAYEWLNAIYQMRKEPSRNEFDVDYLGYLHEQKVAGKITADMEKRLAKDPGERVLFELTNMFPIANKVTYGRITTFCPLLCESDVIKPLQNCIVSVDAITEAIKRIESIDYGAFYRETIYANEKVGISKETISVRVAPDVVLFPNIGTRSVMWQEIEGKKRTTPARFMLSVFHMEDLISTVTRLTGEYRWEMCKRVQGGRWNDVSDRSLTSEYFDYVQFYKKNSDLSSDAKEKVKNSLAKAKNSFKEMFVRDYITWVMFEGAGSPRLNKVARGILITYCPFPQDLRNKVSANPMFKDLIERYEIKVAQKLHHCEGVISKIKSSGQDVPDELEAQYKFIGGAI